MSHVGKSLIQGMGSRYIGGWRVLLPWMQTVVCLCTPQALPQHPGYPNWEMKEHMSVSPPTAGAHVLPPTDATQGASTKQEVIRLTTLLDAFTSFAISQGLRLKELMMPARATPDEVLRRFYIVLDLAKKDKGLLFYCFDSRVCGMCSSALPDIPGPSCSIDDYMITSTLTQPRVAYNYGIRPTL
jgi:hypothetical protein